MGSKGATLADGAAHVCAASRCFQPDGSMRWPASPEHMKWLDVTRSERSGRLVDNVDRNNVTAVALLAFTDKDIANLDALAAADGRVKSYAVLIRRLIAREAKALGA